MSWIDTAADYLAPIVGALMGGGGIVSYLAARAKGRADVERSEVIRDERVELAQIQTEAAREERTESKLWERLERVEAETRRCEEDRRKDREAHEEQRKADREACEEQLREVAGDLDDRVAALARRMLENWPRLADAPPEDDTGVHEIEAIARRTPTPPGEWRPDE